MIDKSLWSEEEISIFEYYNYKCVRCSKPAEVIHEIIPKSRRPYTWMDIENRIPLCVECHNWAHKVGSRNSIPELVKQKKQYATNK